MTSSLLLSIVKWTNVNVFLIHGKSNLGGKLMVLGSNIRIALILQSLASKAMGIFTSEGVAETLNPSTVHTLFISN